MEKNPFSFYDFLGYLFPGMLSVLIIIHILFLKSSCGIIDYFSISTFVETLNNEFKTDSWKYLILIILLSYILGHILAYISSATVEYFSNRLFKYPAFYLLHKEDISFNQYLKRYFCNVGGLGVFLWRIIVVIILFPISFVFLLLGQPLYINKFITRELDDYVRNSILDKQFNLSEKLNIKRPAVNAEIDYHRIVMHYVYLNIPSSQKKSDNYIALYGFLRSICLVFCIYTDCVIYKAASELDFNLLIDGKVVWIIIFMVFICNISFMGFVKFYRRFTLENYMALLTEKKQNSDYGKK